MPERPPPEGWQWTVLSDVARLETGHTPSRKHSKYWGGDIPWIGIKDATGNHGRTILRTIERTNELGIENSAARILPKDTVCLSRTASVGYVVVMGRPMATSQDFVNWVCSPHLDHRFLKYVLLAEQSAFPRFASGTTHQTIYFPEAKAFHVSLPPLEEQQAIASILETLDDKIELNRQMNETLETMARALFKSWFVDFDPVRAKTNGEDSGLPPEFAQLFSDQIDHTDEGDIPFGWKRMTLRALADLNPESWSAKNRPDAVSYVDLSNAKSGSIASVETMIWSEAPSRARRVLRKGDTIFGTVRPGNRSFALIDEDGLTGSTGFAVLRPRKDTDREYVWCATTSSENIERLAHLADGAAYPAVRPYTVMDTKTSLSPRGVRDLFSKTVGPILNRVEANRREIRSLGAVRDLLLPELITGRLRVSEARP